MQTVMSLYVCRRVCSDWSTWFCSMKVSFLFCCQWGSYFVFVSLFEGICTGWSGEHCGRMLWNHSRPHQVLYLLCPPLACLSIGPSVPLSFSSSLSCPSVRLSLAFPQEKGRVGGQGQRMELGIKETSSIFFPSHCPFPSISLPPSLLLSLPLPLSLSTTPPPPPPSPTPPSESF